MRVVVCNKYFFVNGGTEQYMFRVLERLAAMGHEGVPFSVAYAGSRPSPYARYFAPPPAGASATHFDSLRITPRNLPGLFGRSVYSFAMRRALGRMLDDLGGADIGYLLNIYNYMSPSVVHAFSKRGIPVVMRLGDYNLLCLNYQLLRDNEPCTRCVAGAYWNGVVGRCVKGSLPASLVRGLAMYVHRLIGVYDHVDAFIAPCRFMRDMLVSGGLPGGKIHILRQGVEAPAMSEEPGKPEELAARGDYILYFGRLSPEKGLEGLLRAYQEANPAEALVLAGRGGREYEAALRGLVRPEFADRIRFTGFLDGEELAGLIRGALFSVTPSRWYDNAPLAVIESMRYATPVLGARIGGIPEQIEDGVTGALFDAFSDEDLSAGIRDMLSDRPRLARMGLAARAYVREHASLDAHMRGLLELFERLRRPSRP